MKTLKFSLMCICCLALFYACTDSSDLLDGEFQAESEFANLNQPHEVTVPFKATYLGEYQPYGDKCSFINVIVEATGDATHLGSSTVSFDFCIFPASGGTGYELNPENIIVAANGDELWLAGGGTVIQGRTPEHPEYVTSYWRDHLFIIGGTGRFEGASGEFWTDDYNSSLDPYSHHFWEGTITMIKGNRK